MSKPLSIGRLLVRQRELEDGVSLEAGYDLVIETVSWESRNPTSLERIGGSSVPTLLFRFRSSKAEIDEAKDKNAETLKKLCPDHQVLDLEPSIDFDSNIAEIQRVIADRFMRKKSPLRVLMDLSCMPKSYISFICGLGFVNNFFCRLDCLYAEGKYDLTPDPMTGGPLSIISEGEWSSIQVPFLDSANIFAPTRDLIVILGGEIGYSLPFIERYEPARLSVVFIENGVDVAGLSGSEKAAYQDLTEQPTLIRADFGIDDMIGVLRHVHDFCSENPSQPVVGLAIGSKAQSLALALAALDLENLEVVCRVPSAYSSKDVGPTGRIFLYEIEDRFEPMSYLKPQVK